jgi:TatD DNase family protein
MILADTHTHLYLPEFEKDLPQAISRALNSGVKYLFIPNIDLGSVEPMLKICHQYPANCFPMLGMHPTSVKADYQTELHAIFRYLDNAPFVAIGEIGLDLYWDKTHLAEQKEAFRYQLDMALQKDLPVVIHCRESFQEIISVLDDYRTTPLKGVFHAFSGPKEHAEEIIKRGFYLGIGGVLTYKNSKLGEVITALPLDRIILETDAPYLTPVPKRGERNESAYIPYICQKIADLRGKSSEEVGRITTENALTLFKQHGKRGE